MVSPFAINRVPEVNAVLNARDRTGIVERSGEGHTIDEANTCNCAICAFRRDQAIVRNGRFSNADIADITNTDPVASGIFSRGCVSATLNGAVIDERECVRTIFRAANFDAEAGPCIARTSVDNAAELIVDGERISGAVRIECPVTLIACADDLAGIVDGQTCAIKIERAAV